MSSFGVIGPEAARLLIQPLFGQVGTDQLREYLRLEDQVGEAIEGKIDVEYPGGQKYIDRPDGILHDCGGAVEGQLKGHGARFSQRHMGCVHELVPLFKGDSDADFKAGILRLEFFGDLELKGEVALHFLLSTARKNR